MTRSSDAPTAALTLAVLGVVFGDIGTSPLYAFRVCFDLAANLEVSRANVLGLLSLIVWALLLVISLKYVTIMLRADNRGEGGVLALLVLVLSGRTALPRGLVLLLGLAGLALFFADGAITPAISVLSAVEGLAIANPGFGRAVLPVAVLILVVLFSLQRDGTGALGRLFGPVTVIWFLALGVLGVSWIVREPAVLAAVDPRHALQFLFTHQGTSMVALSAVFLAVTGGEALYADMGHFGRRPIRLAWYGLVLPALLLNYLGQGARVLADPAAIESPFYRLAPEWALYPLVLLATAATVIASQAVISGVFSLARQALQLGFLPRFAIVHSSEQAVGQVYVPAANWLLLAATVSLVILFGSSDALAGAYGIAISLAMTIDGVLVILLLARSPVQRDRMAMTAVAAILVIDLAFVAANALKIPSGGWVPIGAGGLLLLVMTTWHSGQGLKNERASRRQMPMREFLRALGNPSLHRAPVTAVYVDASPDGLPWPLQQALETSHSVPQRAVLLTLQTAREPQVPKGGRVALQAIGPGVTRVIASCGFMESPHVPALLNEAREQGLECPPEETSFVVARENVVVTRASGMSPWRKHLYSLMLRNAQFAGHHYAVPAARMIEIGEVLEI